MSRQMKRSTEPCSIPTVLALLARERRIAKGTDLETNLTAKLGRKPTHAEMLAASIAELEAAFGRSRKDPHSSLPPVLRGT